MTRPIVNADTLVNRVQGAITQRTEASAGPVPATGFEVCDSTAVISGPAPSLNPDIAVVPHPVITFPSDASREKETSKATLRTAAPAQRARLLSIVRRVPRAEREIVSEDIFRKLLCWERKRAERTGKCFLLMLIDASTILDKGQENGVLPCIVASVARATRETDIFGWYKTSSVLGVIFTDIQEMDRTSLHTLMQSRINAHLRRAPGCIWAEQVRFAFHFFPDDWQRTDRDRPADITLYPDLTKPDNMSRLSQPLKRAMDITGSALALILCSPLFLLIAIVIKLTSPGPVLYRQKRIGRYGVRFTFFKFRSMAVGSDSGIHRQYVKQFIAGQIDSDAAGSTVASSSKVVYKIANDPRVTRIGRILRRTSLDELPQFINVLRGDMSLVGPRPPLPYELESYEPWHRRRVLEVKPGITGLWQVKGRSRTTFADMVRMDLQYAKTCSPWLDLWILLQTPRAVFSGEGAC